MAGNCSERSRSRHRIHIRNRALRPLRRNRHHFGRHPLYWTCGHACRRARSSNTSGRNDAAGGCVADPGIDPELRHSSESQKGFPALRCQLYRHLGAQHLVPRLLCHDRQCSFYGWSAVTGVCRSHIHAFSCSLCCRRHPLRETEPAQNAFAFTDRVSGLRNRNVCGSSLCLPDLLYSTPCSMRLHHGRDLLFGAQAPHGMR